MYTASEKALDQRNARCYKSRHRRRVASSGARGRRGRRKTQNPDIAMPMTASPQAERLGRLSELLDTYIGVLAEKELPEDKQKRAMIADRDIRTIEIAIRCEERLQAMMAPNRPKHDDDQSASATDAEALKAIERRLLEITGGSAKEGVLGQPQR
jgi:hypothetical protein